MKPKLSTASMGSNASGGGGAHFQVGKLTLAAKLAATSAANKSDSNLEHFGQQSGSNNNLACQQQQQAIDSSIWWVQQKNLQKNLKKLYKIWR
jgi:hypothetical protein